MNESVKLAVNGTLMRGLALNGNLTKLGAKFIREAQTASCYKLWSIDDVHPAMMKTESGGAEIDLEIWDVPAEGVASLLLQEPPGLCIGRITLSDGGEVLGVLGEPHLCRGKRDITRWGGWREYDSGRLAYD